MPIVKRTKLPEPPKKRQAKEEQYRLPGKPIEQLIKEHDKLASDADWDGRAEEAATHTNIANSYRERLACGELYEADH